MFPLIVSLINNLIKKSNPALHALISLKKSGVDQRGLVIFYCAVIRSLLTYAVPGWFPYLPSFAIDKLERRQKLCLRIIYPDVQHYIERLRLAHIEELNTFMDIMCLNYISKIKACDSHPLHKYIFIQQFNNRGRPINLTTNKSLLSRSLFYKYF